MTRFVRIAWIVLCGGAACEPKSTASGGVDARTADTAKGVASASASPSATNVPSNDVVSGASAPWAGNPKLVIDGQVDGAALRTRTRARIAADTSPVVVLTGTSALALGTESCERVVPKVPATTKVLIKPNLGGFDWFKDPKKSSGDDGVRGRITDPEFVRGIVRCLKARGHKAITIAEGWGATHADWKRLISVSGYEKMAAEEGVRLVAMDDDGVFDVEEDKPGKPLRLTGMEKTNAPTLLIPKILAEHLENGLFISAPKIKNHRFAVASIATKGAQGTIMYSDAAPAFRQKWRTHKELAKVLPLLKSDPEEGSKQYLQALDQFAERIADVLEVEAPHVVLADGSPMMRGDGFQKLFPSEELVAVAGTNFLRVDRVALELLGVWDNAELAAKLGGRSTSPLVTVAARRFGIDLTHVDAVGSGASLLGSPRPYDYFSMSGFDIHGKNQSGKRESDPKDPKEPKSEEAKPRALAAHVPPDKSITIDGVVDPFWNTAVPVSFETDYAGRATGTKTEVRFAWNERGLYALWKLEGAGLHVDRSRDVHVEREKLYEEDCTELFLTPDPTRRLHYFEVEVGPLGHFFDLDVDRETKRSDTAWSSKPRIASHVSGSEVTLEYVLEASDIVRALRPGAKLPLGLFRMEGKAPRKYLAFSPPRTKSPNFHVPEAFGELVLQP
ncbi:MAG: DUF362 domain-containing protein [Polyangiaceae bacterium]